MPTILTKKLVKEEKTAVFETDHFFVDERRPQVFAITHKQSGRLMLTTFSLDLAKEKLLKIYQIPFDWNIKYENISKEQKDFINSFLVNI